MTLKIEETNTKIDKNDTEKLTKIALNLTKTTLTN